MPVKRLNIDILRRPAGQRSKKLALALAATTLVAGCAQQPQPTTAQPTVINEKVQIADRSFSSESFYALLVAEMALDRRRLDIALGNYEQQAAATDDLAVIARAARIARVLNKHKATLELAERWVDMDPGSHEAQLVLTAELIDAKQFVRAFKHSQFLATKGEASAYYDIAANAADTQSEHIPQLLELYQKELQKHPNIADLHTGYSVLLQNNNQLPSALIHVDTAIELDPEQIRNPYQKFRLLLQMGDKTKATAVFAKMVNDNPDNYRLRLRYANMLVRDDLNAALEQYQILAENPNQDPDVLLTLALIQQELKLWPQARHNFELLLERQQNTDDAHFGLAQIALADGDDETIALAHFSQVTQGSLFIAAVSKAADLIYRDQGYAAVDAFLQEKHKHADDEQRIQLFLLEADTLAGAGYEDETEIKYAQALETFPNQKELLYARALHYATQGKIAAAEADFLQVLQQTPNNAAVLNALGYTLADSTDRYQEAQQYIQQAYDLSPKDPAILDSMGWVEFRLGNLQAAKHYLQQAMALMPDPEVAAHLGEVLWQLGEHQQAKTVWRQGEAVKANTHIMANTLQRLGVELDHASPQAQ